MARRKKVVATGDSDKPKFMLVWHDKPATMFIPSPFPNEITDLSIPAYQKVAVPDWERWMEVPHFARDIESGALHSEYGNSVPKTVEHKIDAAKWALNGNETQVAEMICATDPLTAQLIENIELHKLMGSNGLPKPDTKVSKPYLQKRHRPFLQATLELEKSWRHRSSVITMLESAIEAIGNL